MQVGGNFVLDDHSFQIVPKLIVRTHDGCQEGRRPVRNRVRCKRGGISILKVWTVEVGLIIDARTLLSSQFAMS